MASLPWLLALRSGLSTPGVAAVGNLEPLKLVLGRTRLPVSAGIVCVRSIICTRETLHTLCSRCKSSRMQRFQA